MQPNVYVNNQPGQAMNNQQAGQPMSQKPMSSGGMRKSKTPWIVLVVLIVVVVVLGILFRNKLFGAKSTVQLSGYQAVFLSNGQVYFGKLTGSDNDYAILTDIYYLQVNQPLQSGQTTTTDQSQPQLSLVKLGSELHGPVDEMHINRNQILFYEDLKADGKVAQAIAAYKSSGGTTNTGTTGNANTSTLQQTPVTNSNSNSAGQ